MNTYLKKILILSVCIFSIVTSPAMAFSMYCPALMNIGTYEGVFITFIINNDYTTQNYVFRDSTTHHEACVQIENGQPLREKAAYGAFILGQTVMIQVKNNHILAGIAIPSN